MTGLTPGRQKKYQTSFNLKTISKEKTATSSNFLESADKLQDIKRTVLSYKQDQIEDQIKRALESGLEPNQIIQEALIQAMDDVGRKFSESIIFIPEMLMAANTMKKGLDFIKPMIQGDANENSGKVMLATVKGDVHDIGKNIVAMMLEGGGFQVNDIGINIETSEIIRQVKMQKPKILGLSSLLTTTMPEIRNILEILSNEGLRNQIKVIVGGAPLSQKFADEVGADGYGKDAAHAVRLCKELVLT